MRLNSLAFPCAHCEDPCMREGVRIPARCTKRTSSAPSWFDQDKCTGCRKCYDACPYGVRRSSPPTSRLQDEQVHHVRRSPGGRASSPHTLSCPLRAFDFGPLDELIAKYGDVRYCEGMPSPDATKPAYLI